MSSYAGSLSLFESESHIRSLRRFPLSEIGSESWILQHEKLEKLNLDAHYQAQYSNHDEYIVQLFIQYDESLSILIHELLSIELWKEKIFPSILPHMKSIHSIKAYILIYHEITIMNLLEILCYHTSIIELLGDSIMELAQYCYRKIIQFNIGKFNTIIYELDETKNKNDNNSNNNNNNNNNSNESNKSNQSDTIETTQSSLLNHILTIEYSISICSLSVMRFLTDSLQILPLGLSSLILNQQDLILQLIPLLEYSPWIRWKKSRKLIKSSNNTNNNNNNNTSNNNNNKSTELFVEQQQYIDQKWKSIESQSEWNRLTKIEGQIWIILLNLLLNQHCRELYEFHSYRRDILLRLRKFFLPELLDQLPPLRDLYRFIEELSIISPPQTDCKPPVIQHIPVIMNSLMNNSAVEIPLIIESALSKFPDSIDSAAAEARRFADLYSLNELSTILTDQPVCCVCGADAVNRCSKCQSAADWYCTRDCQVKHWPKHKELCKLICQEKLNKLNQMKNEKLNNENSIIQLNNEIELKEKEKLLNIHKIQLNGPLIGSSKIELID